MSLPGRARPLGPEALFSLVADEAMRDGRVEERENLILRTLARFLGLSKERALELAKSSAGRFQSGALGPPAPLDPLLVYSRCLAGAAADWEIDPGEEHLLHGLRRLLGVAHKDHLSLLADLRRTQARQDGPAVRLPLPASTGRTAIDRVLALAARVQDGSAEEAESTELGRSLLPLHHDHPEARGALEAALAAAVAGLDRAGEAKAVEVAVVETFGDPSAWGDPVLLSTCLENWCRSLFAREQGDDLVRILEGLSTLVAVRRALPATRSVAVARALDSVGTRFAMVSDWARHRRLASCFERLPQDALGEVAPVWARFAYGWARTSLELDRFEDAPRWLAEFKKLVDHHREPEVRREYSRALARLGSAAARSDQERCGEVATAVRLTLDLVRVEPGDRDPAFRVAGALLRAGVDRMEGASRTGSERGPDRVFAALKDGLQAFARELPDAEKLVHACRRLQGVGEGEG